MKVLPRQIYLRSIKGCFGKLILNLSIIAACQRLEEEEFAELEYYADHVEMAKPLQIVETTEEHVFSLDEDTLTQVLLQDEVKDRYVVVVSVAGAFRKGKSFLLDFFLRYMYSTVSVLIGIYITFKRIKESF